MSVRKNAAKQSKLLKETFKIDLSKILFLLLIIGIVPLIVASKIVLPDNFEKVSLGDNPRLDVFIYYKAVFLLIFTVAGFLINIVKRDADLLDSSKMKYYYPVCLYAVFVLLSAIASKYSSIAFWGYFGRNEGAFVLIAYIIIFLLAINLVTEEKTIKIMIICLLVSSAILSIIGVLQYFGVNLVAVIAMSTVPEYAKVTLSALGEKAVYSTLYNRNYVGSYTAMLLPIALLCFLWVRKISDKILLSVLLCFLTFNWIACDSRAGIVGGVVAFFVIVVMYRKKLLKHKLIVVSIAAILCGGLVALNFATNGSIVERLKRMTTITGKDNTTANSTAFEAVIKGLVDVSMDKDRARIVTDKGILQVVLLNDGELKLLDENDKELDFSLDKDMISLNDDRFRNIKLENKSQDGTMIVYYNDYKLIDIIFTDNGLTSSYNRWMSIRDDKVIERFGFDGMEAYGSNRGYIWSRTIPLLKDTILLGHGPDTFPMYFPQYDFVGKLRYYQTGAIFVDKAHNFYLETAVNTGFVSLLALLALFGIYVFSSVKLYLREEFSEFKAIAGLSCFTAFCGYIVAGLFNDSVVSVAPVFWILFGSGIGININLLNSKGLLKKQGKIRTAVSRQTKH